MRILISTFLILFSLNFNFAQDTLLLTIGPLGEDAAVNIHSPTTNGGDSPYISAYYWTNSGEPSLSRSYFRFPLDSLTDNAIITGAFLSLYGNPYPKPNGWGQHNPLSGSNESWLMRVTEYWDEHLITWNNQPSATTEGRVLLEQSTLPDQDYLGIDVTGLVTDMYPDQNYGFRMQLATEEPYRAMIFLSGDSNVIERWPKLMIIYRICPKPEAKFGYTISGEKTVWFSDSSSCSASAQFNWDFGDGYQSTLQNPVHSYEQFGSYCVCLTVTDSCGTAAFCDTLTICNYAESGFSSSITDRFVSFTDSSTNATDYWWSFGDGHYSDLKDPVHYYAEYGNFLVCHWASNECSTDVYCDSVKVIESSSVLESQLSEVIKIYPNPFSNLINIELQKSYDSEAQLAISNSLGENIKSFTLSNERKSYVGYLSDLPPGMYFIQVMSNKEHIAQKIIKVE